MTPEQQKNLQSKQLELLDVFIGISAGLTWWLDGSSLYHYFCLRRNDVPDSIGLQPIEIGMPRADYETYLQRTGRLETPYFNKSHESDNSPFAYSRLMDLGTTALLLQEGEFWMSGKGQGIYITVCPYDNVPEEGDLIGWLKEIFSYRNRAFNNYILANYKIRDMAEYEGYYSRYHALLTRYNDTDTPRFANMTRIYAGFNDIREKSGYVSLRKTDFHGREAYVPYEGAFNEECLLARVFQMDVINKRDTERPYTDFIFKRRHLSDDEFLATLSLPIDKSFLEDEVRWGYKVNKEMKKVWAVELDLIHEFDRVCRKLGLQWWIDGGTMLGAVRHKGFIPWDDDVDVTMLRRDFDRLLENCDEFKGRYFLQSFETDRFVMTKYRLMNLNTTAMGYGHYISPLSRFQMTGFIDIFALENIRDIEDWRQRGSSKTVHKRLASKYLRKYYSTSNPEALRMAERHYGLYKDITVGDCTEEETELLANVTLTRCDDRFKRYREDYKETVYVPFEMISLPCPRNWQRCLELQYGKDWQTPVKGTQYHSCWIYDSDNAYNDYVRYLTDLILNRI